jgi:hypothetical protein
MKALVVAAGSRRPGHSLGLPRSRIVADSIAVKCGRKNTVGAEPAEGAKLVDHVRLIIEFSPSMLGLYYPSRPTSWPAENTRRCGLDGR